MKDHPEIAQVSFKSSRDMRLFVEAMSIDDLRSRASATHFEKLQQASFYRLIGVYEGCTQPMVDFQNFPAQARDWVLVRPGQVFRYDFSCKWTGCLLAFRPDSLAVVNCSMQQLQHDGTLRVDMALRKEMLRLQLASTVLRLTMWQSSDSVGGLQRAVAQDHWA